MIIYQYVLKVDHGFAPNPFYGVCTLACCKPIMRNSIARIIIDDVKDNIKCRNKITQLRDKRLKKELGIPEDGSVSLNDYKNYLENLHKENGGFAGYLKNKNIWIIGIAGEDIKQHKKDKSVVNEIVFIMQVTDIMSFKDYWNDTFFNEHKRPEHAYFRESWENQNSFFQNCGDNIYQYENDKCVKMLPSFHKIDNKETKWNWEQEHDHECEYVLLSGNYIYFGNDTDTTFKGKLHYGQGYMYKWCDKTKDDLRNHIDKLISEKKGPETIIKGRPINSSCMFNLDEARKSLINPEIRCVK